MIQNETKQVHIVIMNQLEDEPGQVLNERKMHMKGVKYLKNYV